MRKHCPVTGSSICHCDSLGVGGSNRESDRDILRRLLADHGIYLSSLIINRIPVEDPGSDAIVVRLQNGAYDLSNFLGIAAGPARVEQFRQAFLTHIDLSGSVIADPNQDTIGDFVSQGQEELVPAFLGLYHKDDHRWTELITKLVTDHVDIDVELVLARANNEATRFIELNDRGLMHLKQLADTIYNYVF